MGAPRLDSGAVLREEVGAPVMQPVPIGKVAEAPLASTLRSVEATLLLLVEARKRSPRPRLEGPTSVIHLGGAPTVAGGVICH